ncbi:MAG: glycoside hydrolase family 3 N-terminal domain-containing protein [Oscillospiraceae bacterium]
MKRNSLRHILVFLAAALLLSACGEKATPVSPAPAVPTATAEPLKLRAEALLGGMTRREKLCQLLIVRPEALTGETPVTSADEKTGAALEKWPVGGIIYSLDNLVSREQTAAMTDGAENFSRLGLFICADEEGGNVGRLMYKLDTTWVNPMFTYRSEGADAAYRNALTIGRDMRACRFNTDFAPVADVWTNPENKVIGDRAYSDDFGEAAELVAAAVRGFAEAGVISCVKHFPGHGCTVADTHDGAAVSDRTLAQLREGELLPFISGIEAGADMVMIGHFSVPALDSAPASMSAAVVTELLRGELQYDGVVVTDGLEMGALAAYTDGEKCVKCLSAGCDLLLGVADIQGSIDALERALLDGVLTEGRIDESVLRVLTLKLRRGITE